MGTVSPRLTTYGTALVPSASGTCGTGGAGANNLATTTNYGVDVNGVGGISFFLVDAFAVTGDPEALVLAIRMSVSVGM